MKIILALVLLGAPLAAAAQPAAAPAAAVEEFTVTPVAKCVQPKADPSAPLPKVVGAYPADGATIRPGVLVNPPPEFTPIPVRDLHFDRPAPK